MSIIVWILFGLVVGLLARALMPGKQSMGCLATTLLGIAGSLIGGFIGAMLSHGDIGDLCGAGLIGSVLGALLLLFLATMATRNRGRTDRPA